MIKKSFKFKGLKKAESFLFSQNDSKSLLYHLKSLLHKGDLGSCQELIELIMDHGHPLADDVSVCLIGLQVSFEKSESIEEMFAWLEQARLCGGRQSNELLIWEVFIHALLALKEGDYEKGQKALEALVIEDSSVALLAKYRLAYHLFWKNIDIRGACRILEEVCQNRRGFMKAWCCLGFVYKKMGLKIKAHEVFSHCLLYETDKKRRQFYKRQLAS